MDIFQCNYCSFRCMAWKNHMRHTFECHSSLPNFRFSCGISGCLQTFRTFSGMSSHLWRQHSSHITQLESDEMFDLGAEDNSLSSVQETNDEDTAEEGLFSPALTNGMAKRSTALLLLTLKERHRLTQTAINFSIFQIKQLLKYLLDDVKESVCQNLSIDETNIQDCFNVDPFEGLETEYLQTKFYINHFNLVVNYE